MAILQVIKSKIYIIVIIFLFLLPCTVYSQEKIKVETNNGEVNNNKQVNSFKTINKTTYNYVKEKKAKKFLLVSKYLDINKNINIKWGGGSSSSRRATDLKNAYSPFAMVNDQQDTSAIQIKINKGQLLISSAVYNFDGRYIAVLKDNRLLRKNQFYLNISERYMEIINEYNVPVLQIDLGKKDNSITIGGLFFSNKGVTIISRSTSEFHQYDKPYTSMTTHEREDLFNRCMNMAKLKLQPLHD